MDSKRHVQLGPGDASGSSGGNEYPLGLLPAFELPWSDEPIHPCWWQQKSPPFPIGHNTDDQINCHCRWAWPTTFAFERVRRVADGGVMFLVRKHNLHDSWDTWEVFRTRELGDEHGGAVVGVDSGPVAGGALVGDGALVVHDSTFDVS